MLCYAISSSRSWNLSCLPGLWVKSKKGVGGWVVECVETMGWRAVLIPSLNLAFSALFGHTMEGKRNSESVIQPGMTQQIGGFGLFMRVFYSFIFLTLRFNSAQGMGLCTVLPQTK